MSKTALLFSGQGSQYVGMAKDFYEKYPACKEIFEIANSVLGFDLKEICFNSDDQTLAKTIYSQPAILATSLCSLHAVKESGIIYTAVAGHSLGEYAAMVAANILTIEDAFKLIKARSEAMQKASENANGAMCAIIGKSAEEIENVCSEIDGYVIPVNYNSNAQTVIAGECEAVDTAIAKFKEMKTKAIKLNVSSAFHSKLMQPARDEFLEKIQNLDITFNEPTVDFYSNLTGNLVADYSDMPSYLGNHIISPVKFTSELNNLHNDGFTEFVECGPNKVLTGLVKKTLKGVTSINVENNATLDKALNSLFSE